MIDWNTSTWWQCYYKGWVSHVATICSPDIVYLAKWSVILCWSLWIGHWRKGIFQHWPWTCEKLVELALGRFESLQRISPDIRNVCGGSHVLQGVVGGLATDSAAEVSCPAGECSSCVTEMSRRCLDVIQLRVCIIAPSKFQQVHSFHLSLQFLLVNILSSPSYPVSLRQISRRCMLPLFHSMSREV
jgi:hypothetical protein